MIKLMICALFFSFTTVKAADLTLMCNATLTIGATQSTFAQRFEFFYDSEDLVESRDLGRGMTPQAVRQRFKRDDKLLTVLPHKTPVSASTPSADMAFQAYKYSEYNIDRFTGNYFGEVQLIQFKDDKSWFRGGRNALYKVLEEGSMSGHCVETNNTEKLF